MDLETMNHFISLKKIYVINEIRKTGARRVYYLAEYF